MADYSPNDSGTSGNGSIESDLLASLCAQYAPQGTNYAMAMVRNRADAEEIMQEAMVRLLSRSSRTNAPTVEAGEQDSNEEQGGSAEGEDNRAEGYQQALRSEKTFPRLFFVTVRNLCIDLIRKRKTRSSISIDAGPGLEISQSAMQANSSVPGAGELELRDAVNECVDELPQNWREALKLKTSGELSYAEIAEILGATHAQVRTWIFRARRQLERELCNKGLLEKSKVGVS
ncbi:MAG: RNA polymerase sigma factor [Planctomycetota bacterium]